MNNLLPIALALSMMSFAHGDNVEELRAEGQTAVDALHQRVLDGKADDAQLDRVCAQKDCRASRLFWYTDLEEAKAAAHRLGRPILALHLLGRLDEELSCANSRFFRTLLYSDDAIAAILRDQYVLYWYSVRPVPRVTIEVGEGRVIRQTITGNSAHYLLTADGQVLDAMPGLYSPKAFREQLEAWLGLTANAELLREYHAERQMLGDESAFAAANVRPTAVEAAPRAATKMILEVPLLRQLRPDARPRLQMTVTRFAEPMFSESSLALMRRKQPITDELLANLQSSVSQDTDTNEYALHPRIHRWFADGDVIDLASLNERIYRELFLTPLDDPWMGLKPALRSFHLGAHGRRERQVLA